MREERRHGCGCGTMMLAVLILTCLAGATALILNKYVMIVPRENPVATPARQHDATPIPLQTPQPVVQIEPTPAPTVDLLELESRMQDWPDEVTLASQAVFPGDVVAPAGTNVKLISAGPEVDVEYQDGKAKLSADQTDLVARILAHRAQVAKEQEIDRGLAALAASRAKQETDARTKEIEHIYGKEPSHEDAYFGAKSFLKQSAKDPDSVEMISAGAVYPAEYGGRKCWATKVFFRTRDEMGFSKEESGIAYIEGDKAIGYERSQ